MAKVLIVEDSEGERLLLRTALENAGHETVFARDGEEAVKAYLRKGVQIVITDLQMPHVDGLELIEGLLSMFPDAPIIAISGKSKEQLKKARRMGAVAALQKPVNQEALIRVVNEAAESPGAQKDY